MPDLVCFKQNICISMKKTGNRVPNNSTEATNALTACCLNDSMQKTQEESHIIPDV